MDDATGDIADDAIEDTAAGLDGLALLIIATEDTAEDTTPATTEELTIPTYYHCQLRKPRHVGRGLTGELEAAAALLPAAELIMSDEVLRLDIGMA